MLITLLLSLLSPSPAPALDWVDGDLRSAHGADYRYVVNELRSLAPCRPPSTRFTAQHRRELERGGQLIILPLHERPVPISQSYEMHFILGQRLSFLGDSKTTESMPPDFICAIKYSIDAGSSLADKRRAVIARHYELSSMTRSYSAAIHKRHAPPYTSRISKNANVAYLAANLDALDYRGRDVVRLYVTGFPLVGCPIADSRVYRPMTRTGDELRACNEQLTKMQNSERAIAWKSWLEFKTIKRAQADPEAAAAVHAATMKEVNRDLVSAPMTWKSLVRTLSDAIGRYVIPWCLPRFARWQNDKYRNIDDGRSSGTNNATLLLETIVCPSFEFSLVVARAVRTVTTDQGLPMPHMTIALHDLTAAYRYIPNSTPHYACWPVYHEEKVSWHYMPGHPFGLTSSVINFNTYAEAIAVITRAYGVPVEHYVDDYMIVDVAAGADTASKMLEAIVDGTGAGRVTSRAPRRAPVLDAGKHKPPAAVNVVLGVETDLSRVGSDHVVTFRTTPERREKLLHMWAEYERVNRMTTSEAASFLGKHGFALTPTYGSVGRAALLTLVQRQHGHDVSDTFSTEMKHTSEFFTALLSNDRHGRSRLPDLNVRLDRSLLPPILVYTDAAYREVKNDRDDCTSERDHRARLGFVIYDPTAWDYLRSRRGLTLYADAIPSNDVMNTFQEDQKTYIAQLEALAAISVYRAAPTLRNAGINLAGRDVNHFIDNTVALSAMIHGYARKPDLARMVNLFHLTTAGMRTRTYLEYVPSLSNIADLPSRGKFELLERLGAQRTHIPVLGVTDWSTSLTSWIDRARDFADNG